ncbi:hypothetical protein K7432_014317 [Basidiobolus ranarum]|uniref:Major facilitator superfamily (MFS) profile domain-containing protein n=1 Tax=Basidiobolus ranarum TaxID=34480 RepID=A0ABR2WHT6_9FUNG
MSEKQAPFADSIPSDTNEPIECLKQGDLEQAKSVEVSSSHDMLPLSQLILVFVSLALAVILAVLDRTIVATALPKIASDFGAFDQSTWVATAYMLTATACQPLYGKFSDIFGCKPTFLTAIIIFEIGSALSGASQSMTMLIVARAIGGIGGGGVQGMIFIIISKIIPIRERGKYQGILSAIVAFSSVLGPLLGGVFTDDTTWRWAFYVNLPIGVVTIIVVYFFLHLPIKQSSLLEKIKRIDFIGTLLLLGFIITLLLPTQWGGSTYPWNSPEIISLYCVSGALLIAFIVVEYRFAAEPIVPCRLFSMRTPLFSFISVFFYGMFFFGLIYYIPLYYQIVRGDSAITSGLELLPMVLAVSCFSIVTGIMISKTGYIVIWCWIGAAIMTVGAGLLTMFDINTSTSQQIGFLLIVGAGAGGCPQTLTLSGQAAVARKDVSVVTALSTFSRSIGGVLGVAIFGSLFNNQVARGLENLPFHVPLKGASEGFQFINSFPLNERGEVIDVYVHVLQTVFMVAVGMSGAAFLFSLGVKLVKIEKTK